MPLLDHLRELRTRVVKSASVIALGSVVGWFFYNEIITKLSEPVCDLKAAQETGADNCGALYINGVLGPLNLQIKVAILAGVILSAPIWLYQLWAFIAPALHRKEKRNSIFFIVAATPFFAAGAYLGYTILPIAVEVLFGFTPDALNNLVKFDDYLDFVMSMFIAFGITFEVPIAVILLVRFGIVTVEKLKEIRGYVVVAAFVIAAVITPPDVVSQFMLAVPLWVLYEVGILFARGIKPRRADEDEDEDPNKKS